MGFESPFGRKTRLRVIEDYFRNAGTVTASTAWQHVYRLLLWTDERTHLAHVYDANHMQPGGNFYKRAITFTNALCSRMGLLQEDLGREIDILFRGCVEEMLRAEKAAGAQADKVAELIEREEGEEAGSDADDSELVAAITDMLAEAGLPSKTASPLARQIEEKAKHHFTIGNKRKNALGEGFEDLLEWLLLHVSRVPAEKIRLRSKVADLPGFKKGAVTGKSGRTERMPKPDIAIVEGGVTHVITTAKWSMRQDRETQFAHEYDAYIKNKVQGTELRFYLITNEFDVARLDNVARAMPGGVGGYIFHTIYHVNPDLLRETQGDKLGAVRGWLDTGKIASLEDFLSGMQAQFGPGPTTPPPRPARLKKR